MTIVAIRMINQLQRKKQRRKYLSLPLKKRRVLQISQAMKIMILLLKSKNSFKTYQKG